MDESKFEFKSYYTGFFSLNYVTQGLNQSIVAVIIPIYLLNILGTITGSEIAYIGSIALLPWGVKFLFGILSDRIGFGKFGRRKPWIIGSLSYGGILWIIVPFLLTPNNAIIVFTVMAFLINIGIAMGDTALDGMILDICPKEKLGRTQGICWSGRSLGAIAGGPIIAVIILFIPIEAVFILLGVAMILFSLTTTIVRERPHPRNIDLGGNLKAMLTKGKNWKVFGFASLNAIVDGVIVIFVALFVLIRTGLVSPEGASISVLDENINLYLPQAYISSIIGVGVIVGAVIGGYFADKKSRRFANFFSFGITSMALLLIIIPVPLIFTLILAAFLGATWGSRNSSYTAVAGEYSKQYPDMDSTYFSICNSFANIGTVLGLTIVGMIFQAAAETASDIYVIFGIVFLSLAILQNLGLIFFLMLDPKDYEFKLRRENENK